MKMFLDTSDFDVTLKLDDHVYQKNFGHATAEKLLSFIHAKLQENHADFNDLTEIKFMSGPGSFTGLRIGATIVNTLAHELKIPLLDHHGHQFTQIIPVYGHGANISTPCK